MEIAAIAVVCLVLGLVIGYGLGARRTARRRVTPVLADYDRDLYINQGAQARQVVECGRVWTVYGGAYAKNHD